MAANYELIVEHLREQLQDRVDKMKAILQEKNAIATANLYQGLRVDVVVYPDRIEGRVIAPNDEDGNEYWELVDKGVTGVEGGDQGSPFKFKNLGVSSAFEEKLANWMKAKYGEGIGWQPREVKGRTSYYGLGVHIKKKGIRATRFYSDVINDDLNAEMNRSLVRRFGDSILTNIKG